MDSEWSMQKVAWWVAVGALFLIPFIPLIVAQDFQTTFSEAHGFFSGLIITVIAVLRAPFLLTGGYANLFFPFITGKAFAFRILVEIAFAAWVLLALIDKRYRPQFSWLGAVFAALIVWMFIADCFAINPAKAIWSNFERMEGWVTLIHLFALFLVASSVLTVAKLWRRFWLTSLGVSLVVSAYGLLQLAGLAAIHQGGTRLDATLGNAEYLSAYFLFHIFIALWLTVKEYKDRTWLRYGLPLLAAVEAFLLFETQTRGAVLALLVGAFAAAVLTAVIRGGKVRRYGSTVAVALLVLVGGFFLARNTSVVQQSPTLARVASSFSIAELQTRLTLWHMAYEGFTAHPVLGWGQEGYNYVFNRFYEPSLYGQESWFDRAHNWFIDWLVAGGLPAFLLAIGLFLTAFWQVLRRNLGTGERVGIAALLVAYGTYSLLVFDNLITAVLFALVIAYVHGNTARPIESVEKAPALDPENATSVAAPIIGVVLLAAIYFINVPGMVAASDLITALSPGQNGVAGIVTNFKNVLAHPAFGTQEIREQLVSVALQAVNSGAVSQEDQAAIVTLATTEMEKQVAALPQDAREHLQLALMYRVAGRSADALKEDAIAEALSPGKEAIYIEEGSTRLRAGDAAGAKAAFDKAYALGPEFPDLAVYAAAGDIVTGDTKSGQALLVKNFGTILVDNEQLITAYYTVKDWPNLIALLKQYVIDQQGSAVSYFRLAGGFVAAGNLNLAKQAVQEGIKADPNAAAAGQKLLDQLAAMGAK